MTDRANFSSLACRLVAANEDIFEEGFLKRYARDFKRPRFKKFDTRPESTGPVFGFRPHTKKVQHELMEDIASLSSDRKSNAYSIEINKRIHAIRKIHNAVRREIVRDRNRTQASANALKSRIETDAPPLPASAKIGIKTSVKMFLILIKSAQQTDSGVMDDILDLLCEILDDTPPLTLTDGPNFSPDIANGLRPLLDYIRALVISGDHSAERRSKATTVLFGIALARGSLLELLSLCKVLLASDREGKGGLFAIGSFLRCLTSHQSSSRNGGSTLAAAGSDGPASAEALHSNVIAKAALVDPSAALVRKLSLASERRHSLTSLGGGATLASARRRGSVPGFDGDDQKEPAVDGIASDTRSAVSPSAFPHAPDEVMRRCVPDLAGLSSQDPVDSRIAILVIIAQLDRLSQPFARQPDEDIWNDDPNRLAVLYKPLCVDVKPETLVVLSDILDAVSPGYFNSRACPDSMYIPNMYIVVACLRILKVHLYQLVRAKLPHSEFSIGPDVVDRIRVQIFRFLETPSAARSDEVLMGTSAIVSSVVQSEAAQILAEAFEFFYSAVSDQVAYLGRLIGKFNAARARADAPVAAGDVLSGPERDLLELLLSRFASFSAGSLLLDELEQASLHGSPSPSSPMVMGVLNSLISASVNEVTDALRSTGKTLPDSNILVILQNFQKHLLSRAGLYLEPPAAASSESTGRNRSRHSESDVVPQPAGDDDDEQAAGGVSSSTSPVRRQADALDTDGNMDVNDPSSGNNTTDDASGAPMATRAVDETMAEAANGHAISTSGPPPLDRDSASSSMVESLPEVEDPEKIRIRRAMLAVVWEYSKTLLSASFGVVRLASDIVANDQTSEGLRRVGEDILRESLVCKLTRPLIASLCLFAGQADGPEMALYLLPILSEFLTQCDRLCCFVREISLPEHEMSVDKRRVVQSRHPYRNNVDREEVITIKDAQSMVVTFDTTRCSTQSEEDYVQLFRLPNKKDALTDRLFGPADGSNWPAEPIAVPGDTVVVYFHSGSSGSGWGYRLNVLGTVLVTPLSWLDDFTANIAWICGRLGAALIVGPAVGRSERELQGSNAALFKSGVEQSHGLFPCLSPFLIESGLDLNDPALAPGDVHRPQEKPPGSPMQSLMSPGDQMRFLRSIVANEDVGRILLAKLNRLIPDRHIVQRSVSDHANKATAGVFAVLLKHTRCVELAMAVVNTQDDDAKPPDRIVRLWKKAQEMKLELRSLKAQGEDIDASLSVIGERVEFLLHICADDGFAAVNEPDGGATGNDFPSCGSDKHGNGTEAFLTTSSSEGDLAMLTAMQNGNFESAVSSESASGGPSSNLPSRANSITELTGPLILMQKSNKWTQARVMTKLLKNTMKALRRLKELMLVRTRLASVKQDPESVLIRVVMKFMLARYVDLDAINEGLVAQRTRAVMRLLGLRQFFKLVKSVRRPGLLPELLFHLNAAFRRSSDVGTKVAKVTKRHLTADVPTVGPVLTEQLHETYFDIVSSLMTRDELDDVSRLHLLDVCNIDFAPHDLMILHRIGLVEWLAPIFAFTGSNKALLLDDVARSNCVRQAHLRRCPWNIRFGAWSLFRMLAYAASSNPAPSIDCLDVILRTSFEHISLLWRMRQHQESSSAMQLRSVLADAADMEIDQDGRGAQPNVARVSWQCRRCTFFNENASESCNLCALSFEENEELARQDEELVSEDVEQKGLEFVYEADFDTKGVLYYLGTSGGTEPWRNPHDLGVVKVTSSSVQSDSNPISSVVGRTAVRCVTQPSPNQWFAVDLLEHSLIPTRYTLRHYSSWDTEALRSWNLEGSNDGSTWVVLRAHQNDRSLEKRGATHTWDVSNCTESYSHFRIFMTGQNSNDHWYLALSGIEFYGILDGDAELISSSTSATSQGRGSGHDAMHRAPSGSTHDYWDIRDTREIEFGGDDPTRPTVITHTNTTESWHTVKGVQAYSFGRHLLEFRIDRDGHGSNSWKFIIGVVPHRFMINNTSTWIGSQGGWGYIGGLGHKNYNSSTNRPYGATYTAADTVGVQLDFDAGTIEFFKNGVSQGIAFDNLTGPVFAAVSMTGYQSRVAFMQTPVPEEDPRIADIDHTSWHVRIREAHLGDASVFWFKNDFDDVGLRGRPITRQEAPAVGELDAYLNQYLWMLLRCCPFPAVQKILTSRSWIRMILDAAAHGSPLGRLLAVRICRYILPGISPSDDRLISSAFQLPSPTASPTIDNSPGSSAMVIDDGCTANVASSSRAAPGASRKYELIAEFLERAADASFQLPPRCDPSSARSAAIDDVESKSRKAAIDASLRQYKQRCSARSGPASLSFEVRRGTIEISGWHHLKSTTGFATAVADVSVSSGKWYFEAVLESAGLQQIGFCLAEFSPAGAGDGVGDDKVSWAYDGLRGKKWHDGSAAYGASQAPWKVGDVVGVLLDLDGSGEIRYTLSGQDLGLAFSNIRGNASGDSSKRCSGGASVYPAISMSAGESIRFVFDPSKWTHNPPDGYFPLVGDKPTVQQSRFVPWSIESDALGSEYVSLSRVLMRSTLWKVLFNDVLWSGLQHLVRIPSEFDSLCRVLRLQHSKDLDWSAPAVPGEFCAAVRRVVSALSVLGGNIESIRQGARVAVDSTDGQSLEGTVTRIVREPNRGIVVVVNLDNGDDVTVSEAAQLSARSNVELSLSHIKNPSELLRLLGTFLSTPISKNVARLPTARQILMQMHRQALKVLLGLFENPDFVALFIDAGFGNLIGQRALATTEPLADGLVNMTSNLEARALALEKRRRELHDPECADETGSLLRFSGDVVYSKSVGPSEVNARIPVISFDDSTFVEQLSAPDESRIEELCIWSDSLFITGLRVTYRSGDNSGATENAPRHVGSTSDVGTSTIVSFKSDEYIVRMEVMCSPAPSESPTAGSPDAYAISSLVITTNHDVVYKFGRSHGDNSPIDAADGNSASVTVNTGHGVVAFYGQIASHLLTIGLVERPVKRVKLRHFTYISDMDENGIIYFLGCRNGTAPFQNPMTLGIVEVTVARVKADSAPVSAVVGREAVRCLCNDMHNGWFCIDFKRYLVRPTRYTLRHYSSWDTEALRHWKFQGSVDGSDWVVLRDHVDDTTLSRKGQAATWEIPAQPHYFRYFRVLMTGKNSNGHNYLSLSGFELYGDLTEEIHELRSPIASAGGDISESASTIDGAATTSTSTADDDVVVLPSLQKRRNDASGPATLLSPPNATLAGALSSGSTVLTSTTSSDVLTTIVAPSSAQTALEPGLVYSCGHGGSGRLGHGNNSAVQIPKLIEGFDGHKVASLSCFNQHVLALTEGGHVYSWGNNGEGRLGHGDTTAVTRPKLISALENTKCVQICAGNSFSAILDSEHRVWVFGKGNEGQMGNGTITDQKTPIMVKGALEMVEIVRIGVGAFHCLALTASGDLYAWGRNLRGQLGLNSTAKKKLMPEKVQNACPAFVEVRGGWDHSMALTSSGQLYSWGNGYEATRPATGHGTNQNILSPKLVTALKDKVVVRISAGWDHSMALTKDGEAYLWGGNPSGVLGTGTTNQESTPKLLGGDIAKERIVWIDGGQTHTCAVTEKGELWMWGSLLGQESKVPRKVDVSSSPHANFQYVVCGDKSNYAVTCEAPKRVPPTPIVAIGATDVTYPPYPQSAFLLGPPSGFFVGFAAVKPSAATFKAPRLDLQLVSSDGGQHSEQFKASNVLVDNDEAYCTTQRVNVNILAEPDPSGHHIYVTGVFARNPDPESFTAPLRAALVFVLDDPTEVSATDRFKDWTIREYSDYIARKRAAASSENASSIFDEPLATEPVAFIDLSNNVESYVQCDLIRAGRYVLFKLLDSRSKEANIDVEYLSAFGYVDELPIELEQRHAELYRRTPNDVRLELDARKRQQVRNFANDTIASYRGAIIIAPENTKDSGLLPNTPTSALLTRFECDSCMTASGVTVCVRFKPDSPSSAASTSSSTGIKPTNVLLSLVMLPESNCKVELLADTSFRVLVLAVADGNGTVVSEDILLDDFSGEWHHACLVLDRRSPAGDRLLVGVSAFLDGALACAVVVPGKGKSESFAASKLLSASGNVIVGQGIHGQFREVGVWGFALDCKQVHDLCQSSLEFCVADCEEAALHALQVCTFEANMLTCTGECVLQQATKQQQGTATSEASETSNASSRSSDSFVVVNPGGYIHVDRVLSRKPLMDAYTVIIDASLPSLPATEDAVLIRCSQAAIGVRPDGKLSILGRLDYKKSARKLAAGVWYRIVLSVDLQKSQVFVFVNGMLAASLTGPEDALLARGGPFSLPAAFDLGRGNNACVVNIKRVQIRSKPLSQSNAIRLRSADDPLEDGRDINVVARSLLKMGYSLRWCVKALTVTNMDRRLASDYILKNAITLLGEDRLEEHNKAAQTLSLMGFPRKACALALSRSNNDTAAAIRYLLDNAEQLSDTVLFDDSSAVENPEAHSADSTGVGASIGSSGDDQLRNLNMEKSESNNAAFRILKNTKESMEASLDDLVQRTAPKRTVEYPELQNLNKSELHQAMVATENALAITYSRKCVLSILQNWPPGTPLSLRVFGDDDFLVKFMRLVEFSQLSDGLDVLRASLLRILDREESSINDALHTDSMSLSMLRQFAPVARQLLAEALNHMVGVISDPHVKVLNEADALSHPNPGLVIWILNLFAEFIQEVGPLKPASGAISGEQADVTSTSASGPGPAGAGAGGEVSQRRDSTISSSTTHLGRTVFSGPVVNLIFEVIAVSSGDQRLSFVRLLSHLIRLGVGFDSTRSSVLKDLMNHMHVAQSSKGVYSAFFQALIELNVSIEKIELARIQEEETEMGAANAAATPDSEETSDKPPVAAEPVEQQQVTEEPAPSQGIQFSFSEDMDTNGILYYLGTNQNTTAWTNPSELGVVKVTASSLMLDSKPASAIVGREAVRCVTKPVPNQWFTIDFLDHSVTPTHYTLRHYSSWDTEAVRSWRFEGSNDGVSWVVLKEHRNDAALCRKGQAHTWVLPPIEESYSQFRLYMTDQNSNQHWYMALSGFEIYGTLDGDAVAWEEEEKEFVYQEDMDTNGILYYLGTNELTDWWQNPAEMGLVRVEACSLQHNSMPKSAIVGREAVRCVSQPNQDQWFVIDFLDRRIVPTKYTLRHYSSYDTEALRNWRLEGSTDGTNWVCLREHRDDQSLKAKGQPHTWDITSTTQPAESYSKFRIFMFGKNSNDHWYLALSGFEIYGRMTVRTGQRSTNAAGARSKPRNKPWFESVLLVDSIVRSITTKSALPRPFCRKIWKQVLTWPSEKGRMRNADEDDLTEFDEIMASFSSSADEDLVCLVNRMVEKSTVDPMHMKASEWDVKPDELLPYRSLDEIPMFNLQVRLFVLQQLNIQISSIMGLVDFSLPAHMSSLADGIRSIRALIFFKTKEVLWNRALDETKCQPSDRELELDRFRSVKLKEMKKTDAKGKRSLFGQAFQQLNNRDPKMFRLEKNKCAWKTVFKGEFSDDYGGPYRQSIEDFCNELHSDLLPLFIKCPNGRENIGTNREKFVPRPSSISPLHLAMYEFVGKLMGLAIRTKNVLDLDLPSIVWKPLVSDVITEDDVLAIDLLSFKILDELKKFEVSNDLPTEYFTAFVNSKFVVIGSDQRVYPLVPGGHHIQVTWDNRQQFAKSLIHYRLNEFKVQCEAIRRGLATVVPYPLLSLFTWHELEVEVCGRPKMNVDLLEQVTVYESCSATDPHVVLFWRMLRERLDDVERCQFLRFVWGRSRLPLKQEDFDRKFKISRMHQADRSPDDYLPISHTCFFSLELPRYSSLDIMHRKILYAITHCVAIDADDTSVAQDAARRSADVDVDSDNDSDVE